MLGVKLSIPRLSQTLVERSRVLAILNASIDVPLTVVTAPAGYGKTTTVAQWATTSAFPVSWISLGPEDNSPSKFFAYLIASIKAADPDSLQDVLDNASVTQNPQETMELAINAMSLATRHFFLVFDDFHCITNMEIIRTFTFLMNHVPPQAHLVVISRSMPTLPLGRLRANNALREINVADLEFSTDESLAFRSASGIDEVDDAQWVDLSSRAEGWIAGLQLARLSLEGQDPASVERIVASFDGRVQEIDDYLLEEVISGLPADLRFFVIRSSVLPYLSPELCNYVFETDRSSILLRELRSRSLFVVSLDSPQRWLRYHHLFSDALQRRLADEVDADELATIHARTAEWLGDHGYAEQALNHAVACQRWDMATSLVHQVVGSLVMMSDRVFSVRHWLDLLPRDIVMADPELRYLLLWSLAMTVDYTESADAIALIDSDDPDSNYLDRAHTVRMLTSYALGDVDGMYEHARAARDLIPDDLLAPKMYSHIVIAAARYFVGEYEEAETAFAEVRRLAELGAEPWMKNRGEVRYVDSLCLRGLLDDAVTLERQLEVNSAVALSGGDTQLFWFLASVHLERNDLDLADASIAKAFEVVEATGGATWISPVLITQAMIDWARGNTTAAHEHAERARQEARALGNPNFAQRAEAFQATMWIAKGQHILAERWLATANLNLTWVREFNQPYPALAAVRLLAARGDLATALAQLNGIIEETRKRRRTGDLVRLHAMKAGLLVGLDDTENAAQELATAIDLGAPGGFLRSFLDEGTAVASLFNHPIIRDHTHRHYAQLVKRSFDSQSVGLSLASQGQIEALSLRELDVLRLVSGGQSNRVIAAALYISEPTVKKHISNILGKMNVLNRMQAVNRAQEMGLL
jgi:LuxR family maltose regulon positive regulatory protein